MVSVLLTANEGDCNFFIYELSFAYFSVASLHRETIDVKNAVGTLKLLSPTKARSQNSTGLENN